MEFNYLHGMHTSCWELVVETTEIGPMYFYNEIAYNNIKENGVNQLACI